MSKNRPQNPVYPVDAKAYDVCLPKVVCGHCGAILTLRLSREHRRIRCCACEGMNEISCVAGEWQARAVESQMRSTGNLPSPATD